MKWIMRIFKRKDIDDIKDSESFQSINKIKPFCVKPLGYVCLGNETDAMCGCCGHWIK